MGEITNNLDKRNDDVNLEHVEGKSNRETSRLNTNMDLELQRQFDIRRAMGHGTKTEQLDEVARTYLALVGGYGKVSPDMLKIMETYLEREKKS